jgi:hypothetical protein
MARKKKFYYKIEVEFHQKKYNPVTFEFYAETHRTLGNLGIADVLDILTQIFPQESIGSHEVKGWLFESITKHEFNKHEETFFIPVTTKK